MWRLGVHERLCSYWGPYSLIVVVYYVALRTPTKGEPLGTDKRNIRESQRVKGLGSKLSPKEFKEDENNFWVHDL